MSSATAREPASPLTREYFPLAALLSYLVPGLGQISQGRIGKGVLFFVCILTLFYYGMFLGSWSNVYLHPDDKNPWQLGKPLGSLWNRPQYLAQFWVGIAAWPAIVQHVNYDPNAEKGPLFGSYQRIPFESRVHRYAVDPKDPESRKRARLGLEYYDSADRKSRNEKYDHLRDGPPGSAPSTLSPQDSLTDWEGKTLNELQNEGDKSWDLGWVFTVIAGALNIMVIYDAFAGPAYVAVKDGEGAH
jgi:TM2 domain-containing membrane protein YozV